MKLLSLILVFVLATKVCYSQTSKYSFIVIDSFTHQGIPFASIFIKDQQKIFYTNENGIAETIIQKNNQIEISCTGYNSILHIPNHENFNLVDTVFLSPQISILPEIFIESINWANYENKELGFAEKKSKLHIAPYTGMQYAIFIPNDNPNIVSYIYSINFKVKKFNNKTDAVRYHLYSVTDKGPKGLGDEILNENLIEIFYEKQDKVHTFNVSKFKIEFPKNGIYIAIEWLGEFESLNNLTPNSSGVETLLGFNFYSKDVQTFSKTRFEIWKPFNPSDNFINDELLSYLNGRNIPNASIGITVKRLGKKKA